MSRPVHALVALTVLLLCSALPGLGAQAQAGLIRVGDPLFPCYSENSDNLAWTVAETTSPAPKAQPPDHDRLPLPDLLALLSLPVLPEGASSSSAASPSGSSTGCFAVLLAAGQEPPLPALAIYLVAPDQHSIPDPTLSSLFRPPRSVRLG